MEKRTRQLVAWTENGKVRMIPSLVAQFAQPLIERIETVKGHRPIHFMEQPKYLIEVSSSYEALGNYYERFGHLREAFEAYVSAALEVTCADDFWWCYCDEGFFLSKPFQGRFFTMYGQCRRLVRKHPALKETASYQDLMHECKILSEVSDCWRAEFEEAMETSRAWRFGA